MRACRGARRRSPGSREATRARNTPKIAAPPRHNIASHDARHGADRQCQERGKQGSAEQESREQASAEKARRPARPGSIAAPNAGATTSAQRTRRNGAALTGRVRRACRGGSGRRKISAVQPSRGAPPAGPCADIPSCAPRPEKAANSPPRRRASPLLQALARRAAPGACLQTGPLQVRD